MLPDYSLNYICPRCGVSKPILSIASGNTFGAVFWSDCRRFCPMLPTPSPVQRCGACGYFFFLDRAKHRRGTDYGGELGELTFSECQEAFRQFHLDGQPAPQATGGLAGWLKRLVGMQGTTLTRAEEICLRTLALQCYHDRFHRDYRFPERPRKFPLPSAEETAFFTRNARCLEELLRNDKRRQLFRVEVLRELGHFNEALALLDTLQPGRDNPEEVMRQFRAHIEAGNRIPFEL